MLCCATHRAELSWTAASSKPVLVLLPLLRRLHWSRLHMNNNRGRLYPSVPPPAPSAPPYSSTGDYDPQAMPLEPPPPYADQLRFPPPSAPPPPLPPAPFANDNRPALQPTTPMYGAISEMRPDLAVVPLSSLKSDPEVVQCPSCGQQVETVTEHKSGSAVAFSILVLFILGCHSGGCLIPFCCPPLKDVHHTCPACSETIAVYSRLDQTVSMPSTS